MTRSPENDILRHAGRLIGAHGFDAVSVADIADACGMSKQALLYHYRTKDALKTAVVDFLIEHANRSLLELLGTMTGNDTDDRIAQMVHALDKVLNEVPWAAAAVLRFTLDGDTKVVQRLNEGTLPWARYTSEELKRGARDGRYRVMPHPESTLEQIGMLVLTNFALLPHKGWAGDSAKRSRTRKLAELTRLLRLMLFKEP